MFLKIVGIYKKYCLKFQSTQIRFFFLLFCFDIYKIFKRKYSLNIYKSVKISVGTVM